MNTNELQMTIVSVFITILAVFFSVRIVTIPLHARDNLAIIVAIAIGGGIVLRWISEYIREQLSMEDEKYTFHQESRIKMLSAILNTESILSVTIGICIVITYLCS